MAGGYVDLGRFTDGERRIAAHMQLRPDESPADYYDRVRAEYLSRVLGRDDPGWRFTTSNMITYSMDIQQVLHDYMLKDIQAELDKRMMEAAEKMVCQGASCQMAQ